MPISLWYDGNTEAKKKENQAVGTLKEAAAYFI